MGAMRVGVNSNVIKALRNAYIQAACKVCACTGNAIKDGN